MSELFASGRIIDLILVLIVVEGLVLALVHRRTGRGLPPSDLIGFLLSGFLLMLALRAALVGAWWGWISLALTGSLVTHLADLAWRWRRAGRRPSE
ncbi:hypothetical protein HW932_10605 [Allochromatium humboldtianum]|uniref:Uncharacterized protein n=1 Tax=Allochromatium humboldtianum TaxID=504901 RepID=A0A850REV1_9GAMM|nr:hypothetical protein [Allochromatium humboldtianum]NVZ09712.1 hypothetical protein [Allochromatium humboldtianum]